MYFKSRIITLGISVIIDIIGIILPILKTEADAENEENFIGSTAFEAIIASVILIIYILVDLYLSLVVKRYRDMMESPSDEKTPKG